MKKLFALALIAGFALIFAGCLDFGVEEGSLSGTVLNELEEPAKGISVSAGDVTSETNDLGEFELTGVAAGEQTLVIGGEDDTHRLPVEGKEVEVTVEEDSMTPVSEIAVDFNLDFVWDILDNWAKDYEDKNFEGWKDYFITAGGVSLEGQRVITMDELIEYMEGEMGKEAPFTIEDIEIELDKESAELVYDGEELNVEVDIDGEATIKMNGDSEPHDDLPAAGDSFEIIFKIDENEEVSHPFEPEQEGTGEWRIESVKIAIDDIGTW